MSVFEIDIRDVLNMFRDVLFRREGVYTCAIILDIDLQADNTLVNSFWGNKLLIWVLQW